MALWDRFDGTGQTVQSAVRQAATGVWQGPTDLTGSEEEESFPQLATDAEGNAVAVWASRPSIIESAGYDGAGPLLNDLSIPATGSTSEPISLSVSPLSIWSTLGATRWSFGDGASANGTAVTHTYSAPGDYEVTVESEDVLGNSTRSSGTVTISALSVERVEYKNWVLSGTLTPSELGEAITLPVGSTFNGAAEVQTATGIGSVAGDVSVPSFKTTFRLLGLLTARLGMTIVQQEAVKGSVARSSQVSGDETLSVSMPLTLSVTSLGLLGLSIPTRCATIGPSSLNPSDTLTQEALLHKGWSFAGVTSLPRIHCEGLLGPVLGSFLTALISGPSGYSIGIAAPGS